MPKLNSVNPATGEILGAVKIATKAEIEETVKIARQGFKKWREVPLKKRAAILLKVSQNLQKQAKELGKLISQEMGKPLVEAEGEVALTIDYLNFYAKEGEKYLVDEVLHKDKQATSILRYDPIGVVAVIKPWNFPVLTPIWALVPAILTGNSVIFKPASLVSLASQKLVNIFWLSGVPKDVLQILYGRGLVGQMLIDSEIDMVSFTGSTEVGKEIAQNCSARFIKYVLELGGSSAGIVTKEADLDLAVNCVLYGRFSNCGQDCLAIKRLFVETSVAAKFTKKLAEEIKKLRLGTDIGPLVSEEALKTFEQQVTKGVIQGGRIIVGGRRVRLEEFKTGFYHEPTLMIHVQPKNTVMQEEVFGPMLPICEVSSFNEAIKLANETRYGLTAVIFSKSKEKIKQAQRELQVGTVFVNDTGIFYPQVPYQGVKESGVGVESGKHGVWEFTIKKHLHINNSAAKTRDYWFPY